MPKKRYVLTSRTKSLLDDLIENARHERRNRQALAYPRRPIPIPQAILEGILDGDLAAATSITSESTATLSVYRADATTGTLADTGDDLTVTNRDPGFSAASGDYLAVVRIAGEWRPIGGEADGEGARDVVKITGTTYTVPSGPDILVCGYTATAGGAITVTLSGGTEGQEAIILNVEGGLGTSTVDVTAKNSNASNETRNLNVGVQGRAIYTGSVLGGGDDGWYWVD